MSYLKNDIFKPGPGFLHRLWSVKTFEFEDEDERFRRRLAVDDANFDLVVYANVDRLLTSSVAATTATHRRTALAGHLPDGRVDAAHPATG